MKYDVNELRKLAGLPLTEGFRDEDDDDELSQAEKALVKKAEADLAKKGIKADEFDADADLEGSRKPKAKKEEKPAAKKPASSEAKPAPAAKKAAQVRDHLAANPDLTRGQFIAYVQEKLGMSKAAANTYYYKYKAKKVATEGYILVHPSAPSFVLAENGMMNQYQWVDGTSTLEPLVVESEAEAKRIAQYMTDFKFQTPIIEKFTLGEE